MGNEIVQTRDFNEWADALQQGMAALVSDAHAIAKAYVQGIEEHPKWKSELMETCELFTPSLLARMEFVGRGELHPKMLLQDFGLSRRLRCLPMSDQTQLVEDGVEVWIADQNTHRLVKLDALTPQLKRQVFAADHVRGLGEQKAWLDSERQERAIAVGPAASAAPDIEIVSIRGRKVLQIRRADRDLRIERDDLIDYIARMK